MNNQQYSEKLFSISEGGLVNRVFRKLNLNKHPLRLGFILLCITWLPLVILTAIEGTLYGPSPAPFLKDIVVQGRVLVGIPLLAMVGNLVYRNAPIVLQYLTNVLMPAEDRDDFIAGVLQKAKKNTDSNWVEVVILLIVAGVAIGNEAGASLLVNAGSAGSWLLAGSGGSKVLSFAGKWAHYISLPVFQFLLIRWLWRYINWIVLLYRISRRRLKLQPTHPDGAGGLGVLLLAQRNFVMLFVVCGMIISCVMIDSLLVNDNSFEIIKVELIGYIIFSVFMVVFPLFFFTGKLTRIKLLGQLDLSRAGTNLSKQFEADFVNALGNHQQPADDVVDPSKHVDYSGVYTNLQQLRVVPITLSDVFYLVLVLFVPFIPIFFIHYSIVELLQKLMGLLV